MATLLERPTNSDDEHVFPRQLVPVLDMIDGITPSIPNYSGMPGELRTGAWTSSFIDFLVTKGWRRTDGSAVSRTTYADLFAAISTQFGIGDGSTTFNLPLSTNKYQVGAGITPIGSLVGANQHDHAHIHQHTGEHLHPHTIEHLHPHTIEHLHPHTIEHVHPQELDHNHADEITEEGGIGIATSFDTSAPLAGIGEEVALRPHVHPVNIAPLGSTIVDSELASPGDTDLAAPGNTDLVAPGNTDLASPGPTDSDNTAASFGQPASYAVTTLIHI